MEILQQSREACAGVDYDETFGPSCYKFTPEYITRIVPTPGVTHFVREASYIDTGKKKIELR